MKIDLCKLLGVEEGEEFKFNIGKAYYKYTISCNELVYYDENKEEWVKSCKPIIINDLPNLKIVKLPKKKILDKNFTNVELTLLENLNKEYKWIARDKRNTLYVYKEDEPFTTGTVWNNCSVNYARFPYDDIFKSISYEDKKATYIDDYVDRN